MTSAGRGPWVLLLGVAVALAGGVLRLPVWMVGAVMVLAGAAGWALTTPEPPSTVWRSLQPRPRQRAAVVAAGFAFGAVAMALSAWSCMPGGPVHIAAAGTILGVALGLFGGNRLSVPTGLMLGATLIMFMLLLAGGASAEDGLRLMLSYGVLGFAWGTMVAATVKADEEPDIEVALTSAQGQSSVKPVAAEHESATGGGNIDDDEASSSIGLVALLTGLLGAVGWWFGDTVVHARTFGVALIFGVLWLVPVMISVLWGEVILAMSQRYLRNHRRRGRGSIFDR